MSDKYNEKYIQKLHIKKKSVEHSGETDCNISILILELFLLKLHISANPGSWPPVNEQTVEIEGAGCSLNLNIGTVSK